MAVTLEEVKIYLRIDTDIEDNFLTQCMAAADSYLGNAIDDFQENCQIAPFEKEADILRLSMISEMYTNRDCRNDNRQNWPYFIRSMITQLQNYTVGGDGA